MGPFVALLVDRAVSEPIQLRLQVILAPFVVTYLKAVSHGQRHLDHGCDDTRLSRSAKRTE